MKLANMFGCVEMELAAEKIYLSDEKFFDIGEFKDDPDLLVGFVLLAAYGWIEPFDSNCAFADLNGVFEPTKEFYEKIKRKLQIPVERRHLED